MGCHRNLYRGLNKMDTTLLITIYEIIGLVFACWAFKCWSPASGNPLLDHIEEDGDMLHWIMDSSVCPLGAIGIRIIIIWSIVFLLLIRFQDQHKFLLYGTRVTLYATSILTIIMNQPLYIRCIPWILFQLEIIRQLTK